LTALQPARPAPRPTTRAAALLARAATRLVRGLGATWRVRTLGADPLLAPVAEGSAAPVGVLWHAGWVCAAWRFRDRGVRIGVSRSRDGERIAEILAHLGYADAARGSSSRAGAARRVAREDARRRIDAALEALAVRAAAALEPRCSRRA